MGEKKNLYHAKAHTIATGLYSGEDVSMVMHQSGTSTSVALKGFWESRAITHAIIDQPAGGGRKCHFSLLFMTTPVLILIGGLAFFFFFKGTSPFILTAPPLSPSSPLFRKIISEVEWARRIKQSLGQYWRIEVLMLVQLVNYMKEANKIKQETWKI